MCYRYRVPVLYYDVVVYSLPGHPKGMRQQLSGLIVFIDHQHTSQHAPF